MPLEKVIHDNVELALIVRGGDDQEGVRFFTDDNSALQVGKHYYPGHKIIKPHRHRPVKVQRHENLKEVLYIQRGQVKVTFYDDSDRSVDHKILAEGDLIFLMSGGHGFEFLEPTAMIEVKQGPHNPESTQRFEGK